MKILWLNVHASYSHSSLALPLIEQSIKQDVEWHQVTVTKKDDVSRTACEVSTFQPHIVAATCYLFNREVLLAILERVKVLCPNAKIILGGPEFLGDNASFLTNNRWITALFRGDGEVSLPAWLACHEDNSKWSTVAGCCFFDDNDNYIDGGYSAAANSAEELPIAARSPLFDWNKPFVQLETSRGCFARCSYCTSGIDGKVFNFPLSRIQEELNLFREHGVCDVRILDRTFNFNDKRAANLLQIFRLQYPKIKFHLEIHPERLGELTKAELLIANHDQLHLEVGLQTTKNDTLRAILRSGNANKAIAGIRFLASCPAFEIHVDLLSGLPLLDLDYIYQDLNLLSEINPAEIQLEVLKILPGTTITSHLNDFGLIYSPAPPYEVLRTPQMSMENIQDSLLLSRLIDQYYNQKSLHKASRLAASRDPKFYHQFLNFLKDNRAIFAPISLKRRFLLFFEFADCEVRKCLQQQWMLCGMSPTHGICQATPWKNEELKDAKQIFGEELKFNPRKNRCWQLSFDNETYLFIYDRSISGHHALAMFKLNEK